MSIESRWQLFPGPRPLMGFQSDLGRASHSLHAASVMVLRLRCCLCALRSSSSFLSSTVNLLRLGILVEVWSTPGTSASDWYDRCNARPCNRKQIRSLLTIRPNSRAWQIWWLNGSVGRRRATVRQRTASIDHSILLSGVQSGVQCNAMTIDNALLGQNMVISMDSATKHFILTFYEMKNLENS